jgi:hypothetical protein
MPANSWKLAPGLNNASSYQVSGKPWASGSCHAPKSGSSTLVVRFPAVSKWVQVLPTGSSAAAGLRIAFSENGLHNSNFFRVNGGATAAASVPVDVKVTELWFMSDSSAPITFDIVAGLTSIAIGSAQTAEGPSWSGSAGVN